MKKNYKKKSEPKPKKLQESWMYKMIIDGHKQIMSSYVIDYVKLNNKLMIQLIKNRAEISKIENEIKELKQKAKDQYDFDLDDKVNGFPIANNMKQQTALDWYYEQTAVQGKTNYYELLEQAKQMEKQQIIGGYMKGGVNDFNKDEQAEQYYKEKYENNSQN